VDPIRLASRDAAFEDLRYLLQPEKKLNEVNQIQILEQTTPLLIIIYGDLPRGEIAAI